MRILSITIPLLDIHLATLLIKSNPLLAYGLGESLTLGPVPTYVAAAAPWF